MRKSDHSVLVYPPAAVLHIVVVHDMKEKLRAICPFREIAIVICIARHKKKWDSKLLYKYILTATYSIGANFFF